MSCLARIAALSPIALLALATAASADPDADFKAADALFEEGRSLLDMGKFVEACTKFDASIKLNPNAVGALLNVGQCQARLGKLASAMATYVSARDHAREGHDEPQLAEADDNIKRLGPFVPHVSVVLAGGVAGVIVTVDDRSVTVTELDDLQLDPGPHQIIIRQADHRPHVERLVVEKRDRKHLRIPELESLYSFPLGQVIAISGATVFAGGVVAGLVARSQYNSALQGDCHDSISLCTPGGVTATDNARALGNVGTVMGIVGIAAGGVGGYLWWHTAQRDRERGTLAVVPMVAPEQVGVVAVGRF
jgi:tetratricopeptide (TPR) repeat protein